MRTSLRISVVFLALLMMPLAAAWAEVITFDQNSGQPRIELMQQSPQGIELKFKLDQVRLEEVEVEGRIYQQVSIPGMFLPCQAGAPNLPSLGRMLGLPNGSLAHLTVIGTKRQIIRDIDVLPAAPIPLETDDSPPVYAPDSAIYELDAYWPESMVNLSERQHMRGVQTVTLGISPFQYNPVQKELIVFSEIHVRVDFVGGNGHFGQDRLRTRGWDSILRQHLINFNSLPALDSLTATDAVPEGEYQYVIIIPDDSTYRVQAERLVDFRTKQGILTGIVTLMETGPTAAEIEFWINDAYNTWQAPPEAILLMADWVPDGAWDGITSADYSSGCVSDNLYADVDGDHLPDIVFARMTVTAESMERMVTKVIDYETNPPLSSDFYQNPLMAAGWQSDRWFVICSEIVHGFLEVELNKIPVREYSGTSITPTEWSTNPNTWMLIDYFGPDGLGYIPSTPEHLTDWSGDADGITAAINSGAFITHHRDHGGTTGWGDPDYHIDDLADLHNEDLTYVFSMNCLTGKFDALSECFTEAFHRMEHGALGVIAASEVSYSFVNDALVFGIWDYMWKNFDPGYGASGFSDPRPAFALASGKYYLRDSEFPYNPQNKEITYHLFHAHGDAYTTLYSENPRELDVAHDDILPLGSDGFWIMADAGAVIALTFQGEILCVEEATGGWQEMAITPVFVEGEVTLTVTKVNHLRHTEAIPVMMPGTFTAAPASVPIGQSTDVLMTVWDGTGQLVPDVTVTIDGWGIDPVSGLTDQSGQVTLSVLPPYGENLVVSGKEAGKTYYCFQGEIPVEGGADFGSAGISAEVPIVDLTGMLTPNFEGVLTGNCSESDFTLSARGCGVNTSTASGPSNTAELIVIPAEVGSIETAIGKTDFKVFEQVVPVEWVYGTVSGTVVDAQGDPLVGTLVEYYPPGSDPNVDRPWYYDRTDVNGVYVFTNPVKATHWDAYVLLFGYEPLLEDVIVKTGANAIDFTLSLAPHGLVNGTVTDADTGDPLKAWLTVYRTDKETIFTTTTTNAETGEYELDLPYYNYKIMVEPVPHYPQEVLVAIDQPSMTLDFSMVPSLANVLIIDEASMGSTTSNGAAFESELGMLGCRTNRLFDGWEDIHITDWWKYSAVIWSGSQFDLSDHRLAMRNYLAAGGRVVLEGKSLAYRPYLEDWFNSEVLHGDYLALPSGYLELIAGSHPLATMPNNLTDMVVTSYFLDNAIDPRPDAEVVYGWSDYPGSSAVLTWDDDPDPDHGNMVFISVGISQMDPLDFRPLVENLVHYLNNRDWQADVGSVSGTAVLEGEEDYSGILVTTDPPTHSALIGPDGSYILYNLPPGTYSVIASKDDFESEQVTGVVVVTDETVTGIDFLLSPVGGLQVGNISGTALLDGENDHSGISITTVPASASAVTLADGSYELLNVPAGTYSVVAAKDGWTGGQVDNVEVVTGQTTTGIDFLLYPVSSNEPPVAENQQVTTKMNRSVEIMLEASDPNGDPLTFICVDPPSNGTLSGCDDGDEYVTYTPDNQFTGNDSFTFKVNDGELDSNVATVTVRVTKGTGGGGGGPN